MNGFNSDKLTFVLCCTYSYLFPNFILLTRHSTRQSALTVYYIPHTSICSCCFLQIESQGGHKDRFAAAMMHVQSTLYHGTYVPYL